MTDQIWMLRPGRDSGPEQRPHQQPADAQPGPALLTEPHGSNRGHGPVLEWERAYRTVLIIGDVVIVLLVVGISLIISLGAKSVSLDPSMALPTTLAVLSAIAAQRAWTPNILGQGAEEFRRLGLGMLTAGALVAVLGLLVDPLHTRPWVFVVVPIITLGVLTSRFVLCRVLDRSRRQGRHLLPVVVAGNPDSIRDLIERTGANLRLGWRVEAACIVEPGADADPVGEINGVPVLGDLDELAQHVRRGGYRVVAVTPDPYWTAERLRRLAWDLEGTSAELTVAPALLDVAGPQVRMSTELRMPLLQVSRTRFTGGQRLVKELADRIGAAVLLTLLSPALLLIALAIKLDDRGPVFYRQQRVKRNGEFFWMWKFRTMRVGADSLLEELADDNDGTGPQFKIRQDPRITRVGAMLRRFSLDELPQLFNVLTGGMSLVGPRPHVLHETQTYGPAAGRRLLVKPGMTGLWQVSGRSDLTWDEMIHLDLRYVDDWSLKLDAVILWKTARAVLTGKGAY